MRWVNRFIVGLVCVLASCLALAKSVSSNPSLSPEQEQQFTYYWYAALQSIEQNEMDEALMQLLQCEQINPHDATTKDYLGKFYHVLGHTDLALSYFQQAAQLDPANYWSHYTDLALSQTHTERIDELIGLMEQVVVLRPKDADASQQLMQLYILDEDPRLALREIERADKQLGPDAQRTYVHFLILNMQKRYKLSQAAIERYLETDPRNVKMLVYRTEVMSLRKVKPQELCEAYREILLIDPNQILILNNYAYQLSQQPNGDLVLAEQMSQRTIQAEPENSIYLDTYAWILYLKGEKALARYYIQKAVQNMPEQFDNKELLSHYRIICK